MTSRGIPLHFVELDPEVAQKAIEGHTDVLTGESLKAEALYRQHTACPNGCGPTMEKAGAHPNFAFGDSNWLIPRCIMKCYACGCTKNPFDGMIIEVGDKNKARYGDVPIIDPTKG